MSRINQLLHRFLTENVKIIRAPCHAPRDKFPNRGALSERLGKNSDSSRKDSMRRLESFQVDHSGEKLPTFSEAGIPGCLKAWRIGDSLSASADNFIFLLCTGKTEYVFSIIPENDNICCGASYNIVFDLGLFGVRQYFRLRSYKDNSQGARLDGEALHRRHNRLAGLRRRRIHLRCEDRHDERFVPESV